MKVLELLESRKQNWRLLEQLCAEMEQKRKRRLGPAVMLRFAALYRAACADLALADAYQLPPNTVQYLHQLVGRAHNQLYRSRRFNLNAWAREMFYHVPRRLFRDNCLRLAFFLFWGFFLAAMFLSSDYSPVPDFAETVVTREGLESYEMMYENRPTHSNLNANFQMGGFYIWNNTGIALEVFAGGLLFGIGGLFATIRNAVMIGAVFGHMTRLPHWENFSHFVTAHGPFELTGIVLAAAAGMRLGFSMLDTQGLTRMASLRRAAQEAMPTMGAAMVLFFLAALIEGFLSPSEVPYVLKALVAVLSCGLMMFYFVMLGYSGDEDVATG